jgi:hypothetical protein
VDDEAACFLEAVPDEQADEMSEEAVGLQAAVSLAERLRGNETVPPKRTRAARGVV